LRQQTRIVKWVVWVAFAVLAIVLVIAGYVGWWYLGRVDVPGEPGDPMAFTVLETDDLDSLTTRLYDDGLIVDQSVFRWYVDHHGGLEITPGFYELPTGDHVGNVLARLRTPPGQTYQRITFPEGFTAEQMALKLADEQPRLDVAEFESAVQNPEPQFIDRPPGITSLEGLLFPDTYQISNADNAGQVVERMLTIMARVADQEDLVARAAEIGRTPYEVLIVASMIEKEAKLDVDRPKIARVIYNRLYIGMPLQIDATLYYQGDRSTPFSELRQVDGPYNSYLREGLPPTPIANPGRASIRAALYPANNPPAGDPVCQALPDPTQGCVLLYYVLADAEGGHAFAATAEQHAVNVEAARQAGLL
ncbi:MAG: endolytic transglycosylase MltG, partial [Ilumatobacteraceae bacterium]